MGSKDFISSQDIKQNSESLDMHLWNTLYIIFTRINYSFTVQNLQYIPFNQSEP